MKSQIQALATLFSTSSGEGRWRVKTEEEQGKKTKEDESQPLISLGLGIGGSTSTIDCKTSRKPDDSEKDSSFNRSIVVMKKEEVDPDHDEDNQVVGREGCREYSVVRFTEEQVEELKRQLLIFKYLAWGLHVPFQLLLPIWKTFSSSPLPSHLYLYKTSSPPLLLAFFRGGIDQKQMMDPEPGRCRRTDGKKWRCHQSAILNEKYCEKHMHRGSKRSRKLVEASPYTRTPIPINLNQKNPSNNIKPKYPQSLDRNGPTRVVMRDPSLTTCTAESNEKDKQNSNPSNDARPIFPENLDQNVPTGAVMRAPGFITCTANTNENDMRNKKLNNNASDNVRPKFPESLDQNGLTGVVMRTPGLTTCTVKSNENNKLNNNPSYDIRTKIPEDLDHNGSVGVVRIAPGLNTCPTKSNEKEYRNTEAKRDVVANENIAVINQASGLDFSPKSVLQNGMRCLGVESCTNNPEYESRCRRTDGKKWRCKKEVLPSQKYCALHVNRGKFRSKKRSLGSSSPMEVQAAYGYTNSAKFPRTEQAKVGLGLDTNLKILLPTRMAGPCNIIKDRLALTCGDSSSSEATKSDDSTNVSDIIVLSP